MVNSFGFDDGSASDDSGSASDDSGSDEKPDKCLNGLLRPQTKAQKRALSALHHERMRIVRCMLENLEAQNPYFECQIGKQGIECKPRRDAVFTFISRPPDKWKQEDQFLFEVMFCDSNNDTNDWMRHQTVCCKIIQRAVRAFVFRRKERRRCVQVLSMSAQGEMMEYLMTRCDLWLLVKAELDKWMNGW
jgi:hypothetical protein